MKSGLSILKVAGIIFFFTGLFLSACTDFSTDEKRLLVLYNANGDGDKSVIESGLKTLEQIADEEGIAFEATNEPGKISEEYLQELSVLIFLHYDGSQLSASSRTDLERFIQAGGGFVSIGGVGNSLPESRWYAKLVGGYKKDTMVVGTVQVQVTATNNPIEISNQWTTVEQYQPYTIYNEDAIALMETSSGSPLAWTHKFDGGTVFATALGNVPTEFQQENLKGLLRAAIKYTTGGGQPNYELARSIRVPEENRFVKKVLAQYLFEPMEMEQLPDGRILIVERRGRLKMYIPQQERMVTITKMDVHTEHEDGLLGIALDPNYEENHWIYLFYSPVGDQPIQHVSRFVFWDDSLHYNSEKVILEVPVQRDECCHSAGCLEFGPDGYLYISVGDNTNPFASNGFAPIDERPGRRPWDAQRTSSNTNDLRGKILRIQVEPDGSYTIPDGNLFPKGTPNTRPEIYVMGCRNPFRMSFDNKTGYLYWGDVGPDAGKPREKRGPKGLDGVNQAKESGYWGWPYVRGNHQAYHDYNFETQESGDLFDPNNIVNNSPNNTGKKDLPDVTPYWIWYSYDHSEEFPWTGSGGKNPMAGPVYYSEQYSGPFQLPDYFNGKLLAYEWMRNWIYAVEMDSSGAFVKADPFMPNTSFSRPMDMFFGKDGSLYILEYGDKWFAQNPDARLSRVTYIKGNRPPIAKVEADKTIGAAPLTVTFTGKNSKDYDKDKLAYNWRLNGNLLDGTASTLTYTFERTGIYEMILKVKDPSGETSSEKIRIQVGNAAPEVNIEVADNQSFYWEGRQLSYEIKVNDKEDGQPGDANFHTSGLDITFDYMAAAYDLTEIAKGHKANMNAETLSPGASLIAANDCKSCHAVDRQVNGPSYLQIANRYYGQDGIEATLADKMIHGGAGNWGQTVMSAHPELGKSQAVQIAEYILSLAEPEKENLDFPLTGALATNIPVTETPGGSFLFSVRYTDKGQGSIESITTQDMIILRPLKLEAESADHLSEGQGTAREGDASTLKPLRHNDYFGFNNIDLEGITGLHIGMFMRWPKSATLSVRIGSPTGEVIGELTDVEKQSPFMDLYIPLQERQEIQSVFIVVENPDNVRQAFGKPDWIRFVHRDNAQLSMSNTTIPSTE